jgi:hypothetical protein
VSTVIFSPYITNKGKNVNFFKGVCNWFIKEYLPTLTYYKHKQSTVQCALAAYFIILRIGAVHIGTRALLRYIRFGYIARLSQWGGGGYFTCSHDFYLPSGRIEEKGGGGWGQPTGIIGRVFFLPQ